jgi:flavin reductase (DIM6/NTAB) family NADH-FMN oxidoreductase RutF
MIVSKPNTGPLDVTSGDGPDSLGAARDRNAGVPADEFKRAFRNHAAGVAVITADAGQGPVALTATSVFSISVMPNLIAFSVSELSSSTPTIRAATTVVVHLLGTDQLNIAKLCATSGIDRFADASMWARLPTGEPHFPSAHAWVRGKVINKIAAGRSTLVIAEALQVEVAHAQNASTASSPLIFHDRTWHGLGGHSKIS